ncbi:WD40-repeat-containing domain protein [Apodospora peruviana]|uniref:WD40-repeat-containing domain protein n=1 Tax=Apodospora peruviana TaxID=516989 RepID=A0AAE0HVI3_9PEZI|nr:WD40-repeat-containing domain protein [Apodospora peruviana]
MAEGLARPSSDQPTKAVTSTGDVARDKSRKGPSFLSRLSMRGNKKGNGGDFESDSELGSEMRMDGINAPVFSQAIVGLGGGGYIPHHKEPPRYIRTKSNAKKNREFNRVFLAQELVGTQPPDAENEAAAAAAAAEPRKAPLVTVSVAGATGRKVIRTGGAIWATEFSKDGKYLAAGGRDHVVRVWAVISTPEERKAHEEEEIANGGTGERLSAPVFRNQPIREFDGHTGEVLDLSWSKNNFLLSSSMDKTVRLWHISRKECLCTFKHKDFVTRLAFHPRDDRFFLAGSLDTMLRLWSIPDKAVAFSVQLPDLVTAVAFSPDGRTAIAGLRNGLCLFYDTEGLTLQTQIHVRSSRGKNAKGSKITGIQTMSIPPSSPVDVSLLPQAPNSPSVSHASTDLASHGEVKVLITSNDSRIRIYSLRDKCLDVKLKGHDNACSQISASFSDDGKYVICGSEDRKAFIWSLGGDSSTPLDKDKSPCEYFEAHGDIVTTALFAPTRTRMLLGQSGDPIYDLCNPPPVTLRSLEEAASTAASQTELSSDEPHHHAAPSEATTKKPEQSPAYIARSTHYDGNILVTTDDMGIIKVFRQDCAYVKRRQESWETGSTFSRKLTAHGSGFISGGLGRSVSVLTRTSASSAAHSRRGSLSRSVAPSTIGSPQLGTIIGGGASSDRILSWRQGIESGGERRASGLLNGSLGTPTRSERSLSPTKASRAPLSPSAVNLASDARKQPYQGSSPVVPNRIHSTVTSPTTSLFSHTPERLPIRLVKDKSIREDEDKDIDKESKSEEEEGEQSPIPPTPSFTFHSADDEEDELRLDPAGASYSFWNLNRWRNMAGFKGTVSGQQPVSSHGRSSSLAGSPLSKSRQPMDESSDEKVDKHTRRQSLGVFTTITANPSAAEGSSKKKESRSLSPFSNPIPTIVSTPADDDDNDHDDDGAKPVPIKRESSPYRFPWNRGNTPKSYISRLSSELSSDIEEEPEEDAGDDGHGDGSGEEMKCKKCGSTGFKTKRVNGVRRLNCGRCGALADE